MPIVSVVIPTFNRESLIKRCLESLINQTYKQFEVIICDDGSTDNTSEVVESYRKSLPLKYIKIKNFGGPARARNVGISYAEGEFIAFLDSDDWWHENKLQVSIEELSKGADLVYHDLITIKKTNSFFNNIFKTNLIRTRDLSKPVFNDLLLNGTAITNSSVVVRKSILSKVNGISEDRRLIAAEDYDAWLRISKISNKFKRIPKPLGYYWIDGSNISNPRKTIKNYFRLLELYRGDLVIFNKGETPEWMAYDLARAFRYIGQHKRSLLFSKYAFSKSKSIKIKFKALLTVFQNILVI